MEAQRAAIGIGRGLPVDRAADDQQGAAMAIEQPPFRIGFRRRDADRGKGRVIENTRPFRIVGADRDMPENGLPPS